MTTKLIDADQCLKALDAKARDASEKLWPKEFIHGLCIAMGVVKNCPAIREEATADQDAEKLREQLQGIGNIIGSEYTRGRRGAAILLDNGKNLGSIITGDSFRLLALACKMIADCLVEHDVDEYKIRMALAGVTENIVERVQKLSSEREAGE